MDPQPDLIVVGEAAHDLLIDYPKPISRPGGVFYSAVAAAARGARVGIVTDIGSDKVGGLFQEVSTFGIDFQGVEQTDVEGIRYEIRFSDEIVPQVVTPFGIRSRPGRSSEFPSGYEPTKALLLYPYKRELLATIATAVKERGGQVYFDLQHDVTNLEDWDEVISLCNVILASRAELLACTGQDSEEGAVAELIEHDVEHVVVKYGMGGSAIYSMHDPPILIPAYLAHFKCTIGAGDVFNAILALERTTVDSLLVAGKRASLAAATFTEYVALKDYYEALCSLELEIALRQRTPVILPPTRAAETNFYIASHFLSTPMRTWVNMVTTALESRGFSVFSPYREVGILQAAAGDMERRSMFLADLEGIDRSNFVIALLDGLGRGGTSWELGYAYSKGIPILGLLTHTDRQLSNMVAQSCYVIVSSIPNLLNVIYERVSFAESEATGG